MAKKRILKNNGKTEDERPVMGNTFSLLGTHGLPLEFILSYIQEKGLAVDWIDYINGALKDGANLDTVKARISSAVGDVHGPKYRDEVMKRVELFFSIEN